MGLFSKKKVKTSELNATLQNDLGASIVTHRNYTHLQTKSMRELVDYGIGVFRQDLAQYCGMVDFDTDYTSTMIDGGELARDLYRYGILALFINKKGKLDYAQITPHKWSGQTQITQVRVFHQFPNFELYDYTKTYTVNVDCVLLYDNDDKVATRRHTYPTICQMIDVFAKLQNNMDISADKIFFESDVLDAEGATERLESFLRGNSLIYNFSSLGGTPVDPSFTSPKYAQLWAAIKQYDIYRQTLLGIGGGGFGNDKKERLITDEYNSGEQGVNTIFLSRRKNLRDFNKRMLLTFGMRLPINLNQGVLL